MLLEVIFERSKSYQTFLESYCEQLDANKVLELNYLMMAMLNGRNKIVKFLLEDNQVVNPALAIQLPDIFKQPSKVVLLPLALVLLLGPEQSFVTN